jgi:hypothetical protein
MSPGGINKLAAITHSGVDSHGKAADVLVKRGWAKGQR